MLAAMSPVEIRPGVFRPDWSAVTTQAAQKALCERFASRQSLIDKWSIPLEEGEDRLWRHVVLARLREKFAIPVVLVTHDLDEAVRLADRMAMLDQGRVLQQGAPDQVAAEPADACVARLLDVGEPDAQPHAAGIQDLPRRLLSGEKS